MKSLSRFLSHSSISRRLLHSSPGTFTSADGFVSSVSSPSGRDEPQSVAYRRSMLRPPPSVNPRNVRWNACSFIGTVEGRVQRSGNSSGSLKAFTFLEVPMKSSMQVVSARSFTSFLMPSAQVAVQDLNYVRRFNQRRPTLKLVTPGSGELFASPSGAVGEEMAGESVDPTPEKQHLDRLHLWQLFFASPNEWWDNRGHKKNSRLPDFKHKDTKECLWLTPNDPPWVRSQLQLYDDSNMEGALQRDAGHWLDSHFGIQGLVIELP